jgi:mono/diheme cytochrome c family protein
MWRTLSTGLIALLGVSVALPFKAENTNQPPGSAIQPDPVGRVLFLRNCAHCHGEDARGDEGPSLYNLSRSDARIARLIREGIKGEMPRFGAKLDDAQIRALIAYLRTLKES